MKTSVGAILAVLMVLLTCGSGLGGEVPPLRDLRKPVEKLEEQQKDDEPVLPSPVGEGSRVSDPARLCPEGAVWYVTVPDAGRLVGHWLESPSGALMNEPTMRQTLKNNRFGLNFLFSDLPASVVTPARVESVAGVFELSNSLAQMAERMAMASYIDDEGKFSFLLLFDIGLDRLPAFETMGEWETFFYLAHPGSDVVRGDHSGNYLDVWTVRDRASDTQYSEIAAGFAENMAVVSNNPELAKASLALLSGGGNIAESSWGQRLAASQSTSATADAIAFLRMDGILRGLEKTPIARDLVVSWADLLGHGGKDGEAIYYGLQFTEEGSRETFLLPVTGQSLNASLIELLAKRLRPMEKWTAPSILPYQPAPVLFVAANLDGRQLGGILRQERRLFGTGADDNTFSIPPEARRLFTNDIIPLLTGEIGIAFFPTSDKSQSWMMVLPCTSAPALDKVESMIERSGAVIHSNEGGWRESTSWMVISESRFRRLSGHYLVIASEGNLLISTIDNQIGGSTFTSNRQFARAISQSEHPQGMLFYVNTSEVLVRQYANLPAIMRNLYPRSSGLNSRPPLAMLRRYAKGILGTITPATNGEEFTRVTVQAPLPTLGMLTAGVVLTFPASLRQDGRASMQQSRENLKNIWLRLQLYASRFGHFPDNLQDLAADMRSSPDITQESIRALFTAPAALSMMNPEEAMANSYRYLSGITPNDEPDFPLVFEAEPWSQDFTGMYPTTASGRGQSESGEYMQFRQYVRLDGQVVVMTERRFREKVLPRLLERE